MIEETPEKGYLDEKCVWYFHFLKNLNLKKAFIVNSEDGLDEISPYANTSVVELSNGHIREFVLNPSDLNIKVNDFSHIIGKDPIYNAEKIKEIFKGIDTDFSIAVCLNAAAGLLVAEKSNNFYEAYQKLRKHILSGKVINHISKLMK